MYGSFYTAAVGAAAHQQKLNVVANNMANVNTTGFRAATPVFADLVYTNHPDSPIANGRLQEGNGLRLDKTDANLHEMGGVEETRGNLDFAIQGEGFFAVQNLDGENTFYTRDGRFMISSLEDTLYLTNAAGQVVLDKDEEPIEITDELAADIAAHRDDLADRIGIYDVPIKNGMLPAGFNNFQLVEKNGEAELVDDYDWDEMRDSKPQLLRGYLETSNTDMAKEMTQVIEAQRAYSYSLKMVTTSDEVEQEINSLRR